MPGKHGPNRWDRYVAIHDTIMDGYIRKGVVISHDLKWTRLDDNILLEGRIHCPGGIYIDVTKRIKILEGEGDGAIVQTVAYNYNVTLDEKGNVFRYDSPHHDHFKEHHVHRFDVLNGDTLGSVDFLEEEDQRPTLGEVIKEAANWYYANFAHCNHAA